MGVYSKKARFLSKLMAFAMVAAFALSSAVVPVNAASTSGAVDYVSTGKLRNVMYYGDWSIWDGQKNFYPNGIPADQLTHLNFAFLDFDANGNLIFTDSGAALDASVGMTGVVWGSANAGILSAIQQLRAENPNLRIGVSVGGWSKSADFAPVAANAAARANFISNLCKFIKYNNMDFVDLDWEFPGAVRAGDTVDNSNDEGTPLGAQYDDYNNYITLLSELKAALNAQGNELDRVYELSVALPATEGQLDGKIDVQRLFQIVDFANVMTYDLSGAWNQQAGHQTALHSNPADPYLASGLSIEDSVNYLLANGAVASKIVVGCAFYTRGWEKVTDNGGVPGLPGLFGTAEYVNKDADQALSYGARNQAPMKSGDSGRNAGSWSYGAIGDLKAAYPGLVEYWDDAAQAPYLYNGNAFFTFDNERSVRAKADFVKANGLGGLISWQQAQDKQTATGKRDELTRAIKDGLFGSADLTDYNISNAAIDASLSITTYEEQMGSGYEITLTNNAAVNESQAVLSAVELKAETIKMPKLYITTASGASFSSGGYGTGEVTNANGVGIVNLATTYDNQMINQGNSITFRLKVNGTPDLEDIESIELSQRITAAGDEISRQTVYGGGAPTDRLPVLAGVEDITVFEGDEFDALAGVTATDREDGDLTAAIAVTGEVDTDTLGEYEVTYSVTDSANQTVTAARTVTVAEVGANTAPVINGAGNKTITAGTSFDPLQGVSASDTEDGAITLITVTGTVDVNTEGTYTLTYSVADSQNLVTTVQRVITVEAAIIVAPGEYDPNKVYVQGDTADYNGKTYRAKYWVLGGGTPDVNPAWEVVSTGDDSEIPDYNPSAIYNAGDRVIFNGHTYEAKWWITGENPDTSSAWLFIE